ncbi:MAG: 23S rRNA (adenine(2503)-C(2))-methyltransferase RlmN [Planctomycetota bacterium]
MSDSERLINESQIESANTGGRLHLLDFDRAALRAWFETQDEPGYRADQVLDWAYAKGAETFQEMSNLGQTLRAALAEHFDIYRGRVTAESASEDGTRKVLLTWPDGDSVETVWIPDVGGPGGTGGPGGLGATRHTACLSSQVGCPVGCRFCASGLGGVRRNLTAGEIVEQALRVQQLIRMSKPGETEGRARPARLANVVLMGMGEPLANYDAVVAAVRILNAPWGLNIGARKITLSTVGLPKQIRRLAEESLQLNLALSLHAPEQELREELIPWGKVPLEELLAACAYYFERTGREITLEYVLLDGVNMAPEHAARLAKIARRLRANVNLLRYNPVAGLPYERPSAATAHEFQERLREYGVNAHIRRSRGRDIDAACGQLRRRAGGAPEK